MEQAAIVLTFLLIFAPTNRLILEAMEHLLPPVKQVNRQRRESTTNDLHKFLDQRFTQHTQALENLLQMNQKNEDLIKKLIESCIQNEQKVKKDDVADIFLPKRRSNTPFIPEELDITPIIRVARFGKNSPKYGTLLGHLISNEIQNQLQPIIDEISSKEANWDT